MLKRLAFLVPYLKRYRWKLIPRLLAIVAAVLLGLASPLLIGRGIDALRTSFSQRTVLDYALLIVGITMVQGVFSYLQRMILVTMSRDIRSSSATPWPGSIP